MARRFKISECGEKQAISPQISDGISIARFGWVGVCDVGSSAAAAEAAAEAEAEAEAEAAAGTEAEAAAGTEAAQPWSLADDGLPFITGAETTSKEG
jgi:hypothetical protein